MLLFSPCHRESHGMKILEQRLERKLIKTNILMEDRCVFPFSFTTVRLKINTDPSFAVVLIVL